MNTSTFLIPVFFALPLVAFSQNVGIGTVTPTRAKLEVHGVSEAGRTSGILGGDRGISLQKNIPAIGFNQYNDDSLAGNGKYLGNGYAAVFSYRHNDPGLSTGIELHFYPPGITDGAIPAGTRVFKLTNNGRANIMTDGNAVLDVGRSTGTDGTAMFQGTSYNSHFNYSTAENTYIRPGKSNNVYINDIIGGKVIFGDAAARVGINTSTPVYALEIRQVAGTGIRMANASYTAEHWEWRVSGSPTNFYAYHMGAVKTHFSPADGSLHPVSDRRLKTNIRSLSPVLDKILQLKPVSYEMIHDNPSHIRSMGFIAQEVLPLFPQLTYGGGSDPQDMMSLQYSGFSTVSIKGIQEEEAHIARLEQKTTDAEKRLLEIERKIAALKSGNKSQIANNK
ncbi:MAG: tail fiber domain-containing protein [Bacteroidota bacterium]